MSVLDRYILDFRNVNPSLHAPMQALSKELDSIRAVIGNGSSGFIDDPSAIQSTVAAPAPATLNVTGVDGKFIISITNPQSLVPQSVAIMQAQVAAGLNVNNTLILHNLQSASDLNFNNSSGITDYGISPQLGYTIQNPNSTFFWRIRSSYDGKNWNAWQVFSSPLQCGPVAVWAGLTRTASLTVVNAANTPTTQPLTQSGTSTKITVASTVNTFGSAANVTYNAGSVDPGAYGAYYVYCLDPQRLGGNVTYIATLSNPEVTGNDAVVYFGIITTSNSGGGTGGGGGTGPCCIAEVLSDLHDGTKLPQSQLRKGMVLKGVDGGPEPIIKIELIPNVPCFRYEGDNGLALQGCSSAHSLQYDGGGFDPAWLIVSGHRVETDKGPTRVMRTFIGHRTVFKLLLGGATKTYKADGYFSHNQIKR